MKRFIQFIVVLGIIGLAVFYVVTMPKTLESGALAGGDADLSNGETMFNVGGCSSCHAVPKASGEAKLVLAGGHEFKTDFGIFYAPNISPDPTHGIGAWTELQFANALIHGVSPQGQHYYPAFPYTSYKNMTMADVRDLFAYMQTLPVSDVASKEHAVGFPFNIRRSLGGWKFLYYGRGNKVAGDTGPGGNNRGAYLVNGPGHCGECHTPRDFLGGWKNGQAFAGGPNPDGPGKIPNITPGASTVGSWSVDEIVEYLDSGFTPDFDSAGGTMADVVANTAKLSADDRRAIAEYIKSVPAIENGN